MKLNEFDKTAKTFAVKALKENYDLPFDLSKLTLSTTGTMLRKVKGLISESKKSNDFYATQTNSSYMKLVFMEQALTQHFMDLRKTPSRIVIENEEVEKSQVVLAAQDMVDSIQKMIEEVSDMMVKEMPALVDSIQSEIGANESEQFSSQASQALTTLQAALNQSQTSMKAALNSITGQASGEEFSASETEPMPGGEEEMDVDVTDFEEPEEISPPLEEPEAEPMGSVGRAKR